MAKAVLITGSNMGDVAGNVAAARAMIGARIGAITAQSAVGESEPWGDMKGAARFMNQVLVVETTLGPHALLDEINGIENAMGRTRSARLCDGNTVAHDCGRNGGHCDGNTVAQGRGHSGNLSHRDTEAQDRGRNGEEGRPNRTYDSRTMDIDILFYDDLTITNERLTIPHPLILERRFVLAPLAEVMPGYVHPAYGRSIAQILEEFIDRAK